jgi:hypothetical protein
MELDLRQRNLKNDLPNRSSKPRGKDWERKYFRAAVLGPPASSLFPERESLYPVHRGTCSRESASPANGVRVGWSTEDEQTRSAVAERYGDGHDNVLPRRENAARRAENDVSRYGGRGNPPQGALVTREREHLRRTLVARALLAVGGPDNAHR